MCLSSLENGFYCELVSCSSMWTICPLLFSYLEFLTSYLLSMVCQFRPKLLWSWLEITKQTII